MSEENAISNTGRQVSRIGITSFFTSIGGWALSIIGLFSILYFAFAPVIAGSSGTGDFERFSAQWAPRLILLWALQIAALFLELAALGLSLWGLRAGKGDKKFALAGLVSSSIFLALFTIWAAMPTSD